MLKKACLYESGTTILLITIVCPMGTNIMGIMIDYTKQYGSFSLFKCFFKGFSLWCINLMSWMFLKNLLLAAS